MKYNLRLIKKIKSFNSRIKSISNDKKLEKILKEFSLKTELPIKILQNEIQQILTRKANYKNNFIEAFDDKKNFYRNFLNFFFISSVLFIKGFFLNRKETNKKKFSIIIDGALSNNEATYFYNLSSYFTKVCFVSKKNYKLKYKNNKINYCIYNNLKIIGNLRKRYNFFSILIQILIISIKYKKDLFSIFVEVTYRYLKYEYIFNTITAPYLIQGKFYDTSCIKNYIFKKKGGLLTSCIQKNILELSNSSFIFTDVFFSLGKNSAKVIPLLGGEVKKIVPVGSLFMETHWYLKNKKLNRIHYDILYVGLNYVSRKKKFEILENHSNMYKSYEWLKKISNKFPDFKIAIKHHENYLEDPQEKEIVADSNIETIVKSKYLNGSYGYCFNSKLVCTWGSTMGIEVLGAKKNCYFLDPGGLNDQHFIKFPELNKWRIKHYSHFENIVKKVFFKNKTEKVLQSDKLCLKSDKVSKKIYKYLILN